MIRLSAILPLALAANALADEAAAYGYTVERWNTESGLPQNSVTSLTQTKDGFLWVGTLGGLVRFDGVRFEVFDLIRAASPPSTRVRVIYETRDGAFYIGSEDRGLFRRADGSFERIGEGEIHSIVEDDRGRVWVGGKNGLFHVAGSQLEPFPDSRRLPSQNVIKIAAGPHGKLFVATEDGLVTICGDTVAVIEPLIGVRDVIVAGDGSAYAATKRGLARLAEGSPQLEFLPDFDADVHSVLELRDDSIVCGGPFGLKWWRDGVCVHSDSASLGSSEGFAREDRFRSLLEDREGLLWAGTEMNGLVKLTPSALRGFKKEQGLDGDMVGPLLELDCGGVLAGTLHGLFRTDDGERFASVDVPEAMGNLGSVIALARDGQGGILVGAGRRLWRWQGESAQVLHEFPSEGEYFRAVVPLPNGEIWAGGLGGVLKFSRDLKARGASRDDLPRESIYAIEPDPDGGMWIGGERGVAFVGDSIDRYTTAHGLSPGTIRAIRAEVHDGEKLVWFGSYGGGMCLLRDGRFSRLTTEHGLPDNLVSRIVAAGVDDLFLNTNHGIARIRRSEALEVAAGRMATLTCQLYGIAPGFRSSEGLGGRQPSGMCDSRGRLWFPSIDGLVLLDPSHDPPQAVVDAAAVVEVSDGHRTYVRKGPLPIALPLGARDLSFTYTALSFRHPRQIRFRYRLDGLDRGWVEAGARRSAFYTNLEPGDYTFRVMSCNAEGVWGDDAELPLTVPARFHETAGFRAVAALFILALGTALLHRRTRAIERRAAELERVVATRTAELARHRDDLENRVGERTSELERAYARLREDFAERERLQSELGQAQKLESLGRLAGGVAHDFNNLLTVIMGFTEVGEQSLNDEKALRSSFEQIRRAGENASNLTSQLLAVARRQVVMPHALDPNAIVSGLANMLGRLLGEDVRLDFRPGKDVAPVFADRHAVEQVILNLAVNARDAMPKGGQLSIETRNIVLPAPSIPRTDLPAGDYVELLVRDDGVGMDDATLARAFEPFFTTKEPGRGTGLGLSTSYGLIRQLGGDVLIDSARGKGTVVRVLLPRSRDVARPWAPPAPESSDHGIETVLVVEDQEQVRHVTCTMLRHLGYRVLEAKDAGHALEVAAAEPVDLLLTDVVMPEMHGPEVAERVQRLQPGAAVLFMSGYLESVIANRGLVPPGLSVLQKPFDFDELARAVRQALASAERVA